MDTIVQSFAVAESAAPSNEWSWELIGTMLMAASTFFVAVATGFTLRIAKASNKRQERERLENLKAKRAEKLMNLINFILDHREMLHNKPYPQLDISERYETIIVFNISNSEEAPTKKVTRHNFVIVREVENNNNILSFSFIGEYKVDPMSIEIDIEPKLDSRSEEWDKLFSALKNSLNIALFQSNFDQNEILDYYEMDAKILNRVEVRGHVGMNSKADKKLTDAILSINVESTRKLVKKITHIDARDVEGKTFLHYAVKDAHSQIVSDENYSENRDKETLHKGISKNHALKMQKDLNTIISILIDEGADVNAKDNHGAPVIYCAASTNNPRIIYILEASGADVNAISDHNNGTAIHIASHSGWNDVVEKLIQHGAKLDCKNSNGETPLHMASASGWASVIRKLIDHGLNVDVKDNLGETPLHKAAFFGAPSAVEELIEKGADKGINSENIDGETPLHHACWSGSRYITEVLIHHGSDINMQNKNGETPLHIAIKNMQFGQARFAAVASALIGHDADIFCKDKDGNSPNDLILEMINENRWLRTLLGALKQKLSNIFRHLIKH